ncbi:MAG: glucose-6-phosphate isomerase family protein [Candidatus Aenigmatarchaeota archaeon]
MKVDGLKIKGDYILNLEFEEEPFCWQRKMSELIKEKVILDLRSGRKALEFFGDRVVYFVYNLWKGIRKYNIIKEKFGLNFDLTLLKKGIFSVEKNGELFLTYGHKHEKNRGEFYKVIKNECIILLSDIEKKKSYFVELKEGDSIFISPRYIHRLISKNVDCLILGVVPEDAGHNYEIVKNRGFPFHFFLKDSWIKIVENKKYKNHKIFKAFPKNREIPIEKLKKVLYNPKNYKNLYDLNFF